MGMVEIETDWAGVGAAKGRRVSIELVLLTNSPSPIHGDWKWGRVHATLPAPASVAQRVTELASDTRTHAVLCWDVNLGWPDADVCARALESPGDVWHAGLQLGMGGLPGLIDFVAPTWMLNRDASANVESTSWRLSLRACLMRVEVLRQLGGPSPHFETLEGTALEMGHRFIGRGAIPRAVPGLIKAAATVPTCKLPFDDELRFVHHRYGRAWSFWALARAALSGYVSPLVAVRSARRVLCTAPARERTCYRRPTPDSAPEVADARVSVLIPTLDRYTYLRNVLKQLGDQTVRPMEVIVIDQTARGERQSEIYSEFADLPLVVQYQDEPGQCSSRNRGLQIARGDYILFLDDDDEIRPDLIECHLRHLARWGIPVSCGVAHEMGAGPLPEDFTIPRASDVFPTNNTMIRKSVLNDSGLFDLAYDRGQRADGDLGMRVYLSGNCMALAPDIDVLHHHAPRGGLRAHKARVITYASSRERLTHRHLPSVSDLYLARRYFSERQIREAYWQSVAGTLSARGPAWKRAAKVLMGFAWMPSTLWSIRKRARQAARMFEEYPQIPTLHTSAASARGQEDDVQ